MENLSPKLHTLDDYDDKYEDRLQENFESIKRQIKKVAIKKQEYLSKSPNSPIRNHTRNYHEIDQP